MFKMNVDNKEYSIKFGYLALCKSGVLTDVIELQKKIKNKNDEEKKKEEERKQLKEDKEKFPEYYSEEELKEDLNENKDDDLEEVSESLQILQDIMGILPNLILAGLQKKHKDEFLVDYDSEENLKEKLAKVVDLLDDYMDEDDSLDITDLFAELTDELFESNFLSKKSPKLEKAMETQNATLMPTDHLQPQN